MVRSFSLYLFSLLKRCMTCKISRENTIYRCIIVNFIERQPQRSQDAVKPFPRDQMHARSAKEHTDQNCHDFPPLRLFKLQIVFLNLTTVSTVSNLPIISFHFFFGILGEIKELKLAIKNHTLQPEPGTQANPMVIEECEFNEEEEQHESTSRRSAESIGNHY